MSSKTIGVRFPDNLIETIKADGGKFNTTVIERLQNSMSDNQAAMLDIKGIFTPGEWTALAESLKDILIDKALLYDREMVIAYCESSELAKGTLSRFGADDLCQKVAHLTRIQTATVLRRVASFWRNCLKFNYADGQISLEAWANY